MGDPRYFMGGGSSSYDYEQQQGYFHGNGEIGGGGFYHDNDGLPPPSYYDNNMTSTNNRCPGGGSLYNGIQFQASENCPKNYVIFDQTNNTSRIMLNPSYAQKLGCPGGFDVPTTQHARGGKDMHERDDRYISSSSFKEDSEDIDALLSLDNDDGEEDDEDDVVSTGRTRGRYNCDSPDSTTSTAASRYGKQRCSSAGGRSSDRKREKVKKMVKVLRGIVPGGQKMDTPAFLDEAVKYLKSLKMEVKKLGIQNSNG